MTGGFELEPNTVAAAQRNGVSLLISPRDTATTTEYCRASIAVRHVVREQFLAFRKDQPLAEIKDLAAESNFLAFPAKNNCSLI